MYTKKVSILTCLLLLTGLCAIGLFSLLYRFDNKYIMRASLSQEGFSVIKGDSSDPRKITYLAEGWEFYPDVEASPDELSDYILVFLPSIRTILPMDPVHTVLS